MVTWVTEDQRNQIHEKVSRDWKQQETVPVLRLEGHMRDEMLWKPQSWSFMARAKPQWEPRHWELLCRRENNGKTQLTLIRPLEADKEHRNCLTSFLHLKYILLLIPTVGWRARALGQFCSYCTRQSKERNC